MNNLLRDELSTIFSEEVARLRANDLLYRVRDSSAAASAEVTAMRAWNMYERSAEQLATPALDTSPRAVKTRAVLRIAQTYEWQSAIAHFLDARGVAYISELSDPQLDDLAERMHGYVDAAMTGCSLSDCLPAS